MRTGRILPFLIFFLLLVFPWAFAQSPAPSLEVFLEGGASFLNGSSGQIAEVCPVAACPIGVVCSCPSGALSNTFSRASRAFAGGRYRFTRHDAVEASYSYSPNHFTMQPSGLPAASAYNRVDLISFNYVRYLWVKARVQPFVTAGVGVNRFSGPSNAPAVIDGYVSADNGWQFAWNYGGGADLVFLRYLALRLELRDYVTGQPAAIHAYSNTITGTSHNVAPSVGIVFRFK